MRERPIRFNGAMVRAILSGAKTQTRRAIKDQPTLPTEHWQQCRGRWMGTGTSRATGGIHQTWGWAECPFGQPGDRLWVRETTVKVEEHGYVGPVYAASDEGRTILNYGLAPDPDDCIEVEPEELRLRPSIHMPRSMCRLVLEITAVRVERLQAISEADAEAEGTNPVAAKVPTHRDAFRYLWGDTGGDWESNPWVWVIGFRLLEAGQNHAASDTTKETRDGRS